VGCIIGVEGDCKKTFAKIFFIRIQLSHRSLTTKIEINSGLLMELPTHHPYPKCNRNKLPRTDQFQAQNQT